MINQMRPHLHSALSLFFGLPPVFIKHIADRLGCGLAVMMQSCYHLFDTDEEWGVVGGLLDIASQHQGGRPFVFNGILSCLRRGIPTLPLLEMNFVNYSSSLTNEERGPDMGVEGASLFSRLLTKFVFGSYEMDTFFSVPAMHCLEHVYWYLLILSNDASTLEDVASHLERGDAPVPDEDLWQSICMGCYSICLSPDPAAALQGSECLQRFLLNTEIGSVSDFRWISILDTISMRHPPATMQDVRTKLCQLVGKLLLAIIPHLAKRKENWNELTDIINRLAPIVAENLREGRRGSVQPLFETTVETVTNLSNVMSMPEFDESGFSRWSGETLFAELEKVGACGGDAKLMAATRSRSGQTSSAS